MSIAYNYPDPTNAKFGWNDVAFWLGAFAFALTFSSYILMNLSTDTTIKKYCIITVILSSAYMIICSIVMVFKITREMNNDSKNSRCPY